jgi:hypothetical protein
MKKILTLALFGGLFAATTLQAQVQVFISGSTAFRSNAYRAIGAMFDASPPVSINAQGKGSGASLMTFQGTIGHLFGAQTVTIYADWTGSVQGIHSLTAGDTLTFLTNPSPDGDTNTFTSTCDLAFSDVFQLSSGFNTPALNDVQVAIQPFVYVKSINAPSSITNITMQQLRFALQGSCPLSYLTGNTNNYYIDGLGNTIVSNTVYFTGRNKDSGSRIVSLSDAAYSGSYSVYWVTNHGSGGGWEKMTVNFIGGGGVNYGPGFASGSQEAGVFTASTTNGAGCGIGYIGYADARTAVAGGGGAQLITYNGGLPFNGWQGTTNGFDNPDWTPVTTGKYSLWGPEHLFINPSDLNFANANLIFTNLPPYVDLDISNTVPVTAIRLSQMGNTARSSDGGKISP